MRDGFGTQTCHANSPAKEDENVMDTEVLSQHAPLNSF